MTRKIKAHDVKPGQEIEWKYGGYYTRCVVGLVRREDLSYPAFSIRPVGSSAGWKIFSEGDEVTVLKEPQPPEPTAFGAAVEAGGVWFVRLDVRDLSDPDFQPWQSESLIQCTWAEVCDQGPVTVVNADPFATVQAEKEARVWERWEDVPKLTPVHVSYDIETLYRKVGDRIEFRRGGSWVPAFADEHDLNKFSPFTEVLPGA